MMEDFEVRGKIYYECALAPDYAETNPKLLLHLPDSFQKRKHCEIKPRVCEEITENDFAVRGSYPRDSYIRQDNRLIIRCFCETKNRYGATCNVDAGVASIPLYDAWESVNRNRSYDTRMPLVMHTAGEERKGNIRVVINPGDLRMGALKFEDKSSCDEDLRCNSRNLACLFNDYVGTCCQIEENLPLHYQGTQGIRCPCDPGEERLCGAPQIRPPAVAYVMYDLPDCDEAFWENLMHVVFRRAGLKDNQYCHQPLKERACLLAKMVCAIPQYLDYIRDFVDRNKRKYSNLYTPDLQQAVESFGDALRTGSGDCEDLACAICQMFDAFRAAKRYENPILHELHCIAKQYISFMCLDGVTASHIQNNVRCGRCGKKMGAHMNVNLVPLNTAYAFIARSCSCDNVCKLSKSSAAQIMNCAAKENTETWTVKLPVLVCEGTGMFDALGRMDPAMEARHYFIETTGAFKTVKKPIIHPRHNPSTGVAIESPFFKTVMMAFTNYWLRKGIPVGGFWWASSDGRGCCSRGASYCDFLDKGTNVVLIPQPLIGKEMMVGLHSIVKNRIPPPKFRLDNEVCLPKCNPCLDQIKNAIAQLGRECRGCGGCVTVDVYARPQALTDQFCKRVICALMQRPRVISMDYSPEILCKNVTGYRIVFHVCSP